MKKGTFSTEMNAIMDSIFIDSNVWVYLFSADDENKRNIAEQFIKTNGNKNIFVISYQVINEVTKKRMNVKAFVDTNVITERIDVKKGDEIEK